MPFGNASGQGFNNPANNKIILVENTPGTGIFVYSPTPGLGNLIGSWTTLAGTDKYGNTYPAGFNITVGAISGTTFSGTNFFINPSGAFYYSGTPALGNLIFSQTNAAGTDAFGNAYLQGVTSYLFSSGIFTAENINGGVTNWYESATAGGPYTLYAAIGFSFGGGLGSLLLQAGKQVILGLSGAAIWDDSAQLFTLPAAGGPFIAGETFHTVTNGTNFTGTMRVKLLPWGAVWLDVQISYTAVGAVTANFGSLPSASYYPTVNRQFALSCTQAQTALASSNRVFVPTSGTVQVIIPQALAAASGLSLSVIYPTT